MDGTATLTGLLISACPECHEDVINSGGLQLDPVPVVGGLYAVGPGFRKRRALTRIAGEVRERRPIYGGGHDIHECPLPVIRNWYDR